MAQTQTAGSTVVGYFEDHDGAERAVTALREAGFTSAHLGVAHRDDSYSASNTGSSTAGSTVSGTAHAAGAKAEGMWDKVKNFFEGGDSAEPYSGEKQEGNLGTREITDSGYTNNDFGGTLSSMSVPEDRSKYFDHRFSNNERGTLVTVSAPGRENEAETILKQYGADLGEGSANYDYSSQPANAQVAGTQNIELLGEVLRVHKDRIDRGEVRLRKEVVTEMQTVQVPVTREELVIERHTVAGNTPATGSIGDTGEIRIPLSEERASVDKSTFVREEVSVGKRSVEEVRDLSGEVRSEELVVDDETKTVR